MATQEEAYNTEQPTEHNLRCPKCKSEDVEKEHAGFIGGEYFATYHCLNCDHSDTVDEYQMEDWFS